MFPFGSQQPRESQRATTGTGMTRSLGWAGGARPRFKLQRGSPPCHRPPNPDNTVVHQAYPILSVAPRQDPTHNYQPTNPGRNHTLHAIRYLQRMATPSRQRQSLHRPRTITSRVGRHRNPLQQFFHVHTHHDRRTGHGGRGPFPCVNDRGD